MKTKKFEKCDQCEAVMINGVYCHETGCPKAWQTKKECAWCGSYFMPGFKGQPCCSNDCMENYKG